MFKKLKISFLFILICFVVNAQAQEHHWNYSSTEGWTGACSAGQAQSPIDISRAVYDPNLGDLGIAWNISSGKAFYNGHTVEVPYEVGSSVTFKGQEFQLKQFHFH